MNQLVDLISKIKEFKSLLAEESEQIESIKLMTFHINALLKILEKYKIQQKSEKNLPESLVILEKKLTEYKGFVESKKVKSGFYLLIMCILNYILNKIGLHKNEKEKFNYLKEIQNLLFLLNLEYLELDIEILQKIDQTDVNFQNHLNECKKIDASMENLRAKHQELIDEHKKLKTEMENIGEKQQRLSDELEKQNLQIWWWVFLIGVGFVALFAKVRPKSNL